MVSKQRKPTDKVVLEIRDCTKTGSFYNISFKLLQGEILSICGTVGSGKEELCKALYGETKLTSGTILIEGKPESINLPSQAFSLGIGYISEDRRNEGLVPVSYTHLDVYKRQATVASDAFWQGGMGLSIPLAVKQGKIKMEELPENKREWIAQTILITQENIDWYIENYVEGTPEYNWNDYWGKWVRGINCLLYTSRCV